MIAPDDDVLAPIRRAILDLRRLMPSFRSGTVTSVSPLRVQMDGETAPVSALPVTMAPVGPGDRVRVTHYGTTHLILGRVNTNGIPYREAAGVVAITMNGGYAGATVNFPAGRFTVPPIVTWGRSHSGSTSSTIAVNPANLTTSSVVIGAYGTYTGTVTVWWRAVQMTPTSAEG